MNLLQSFDEFLESTTVHGFAYIHSRHPGIFRILWVNPIYKTTNVFPIVAFFSETTAPAILMKLGIHFIHSQKMVLK